MTASLPPHLRLDDFLPFRLAVLSNAISGRIRRIYAEEFNLSVWEWRVLAILGDGAGLTSTEVSARAIMDKPLVSRTVASLLQRGLISRKADPKDKRRAMLSLTPSGGEIYAAIVPRAVAIEKEFLSAFSETQLADLDTVLGQLARIASPGRPLWDRGQS
jgi:DNA-binding MarR family transcriptional regulator